MKINAIKINNFGILHNIQLDMSGENGRLVFLNANNGRGKTTFLSSLKWCFYGKHPGAAFLSNFALAQASNGDSIPVSVSVEIDLDKPGASAFIERRQLFEKVDNGKSKPVGQSILIVKERDASDSPFTDIVVDPEIWLRNFFPERLINFFLFNGELMADFFNANVKGAIEDAIREIAKVDLFEKLAREFEEVEKSLNRKISRLSGTRAEAINANLEVAKRLMVDIYTEMKQAEADLQEKKERREEVLKILGELEGLADSAEKLRKLDAEILENQSALREAEEDFQSSVLGSGTASLMEAAFAELRSQVLKAEQEDRLPPPFDPARVQQLIQAKTCICGTHLEEGDEKTAHLHRVIERYTVATDVGKLLTVTARQVEQIESGIVLGWKYIQDKNKVIVRIRTKIEALKAEKDGVLDLLKGNDPATIQMLANEKRNLDRQIEQLIETKASLAVQGSNKADEVARLDKDFAEASKGNAEADGLRLQSDLANKLAKEALDIHRGAISSVREQLEKAVSENFSVVKKGKFRTVITENFEVLTQQMDGTPTVLAEGERMMKAYIFSIALRDVINLGFPLVVDTPFGRLDEHHKAELAKMLLSFLEKKELAGSRQIIFNMHDGEYSPYTKGYFAKAKPLEAYLAWEEGFEDVKSNLGLGIDPDWTKKTAWKDWAEGKIK